MTTLKLQLFASSDDDGYDDWLDIRTLISLIKKFREGQSTSLALHEAMRIILMYAPGYQMQVAGLADAMYIHRLYVRENGEQAECDEIRARCAQHPELFKMLSGNVIKLIAHHQASRTLHEAMRIVLMDAPGYQMHAAELADAIYVHRLYVRENGEQAECDEIRARCTRHPRLFKALPGNIIKLKFIDGTSGNAFLDLLDMKLCMEPYCTTCGCKQFRAAASLMGEDFFLSLMSAPEEEILSRNNGLEGISLALWCLPDISQKKMLRAQMPRVFELSFRLDGFFYTLGKYAEDARLFPYRHARDRYRPAKVRALFIGESRPANGTYFYYGNSNLFNYTKQAFEQAEDQGFNLDRFRAHGCWLYDVCDNPVNQLEDGERSTTIIMGLPLLQQVLHETAPEYIFVIKRGVFGELVYPRILNEGYVDGVTAFHLPFPACGQQNNYVLQLADMLRRTIFRVEEDL